MGLVVYNTLSRRKEEFVPRNPHVVTIYQCGVTPYDYTHLGHARQYVFWDVVCRYLEYKGYRTLCIQNFTDIDDKLIAKANETGKSVREVAEHYSADFLEAMDGLGIRRASAYPRATDHIPDIIEMIRTLIDKGFAYRLDGDVYFDVSRFAGYGKLSHKNPEELAAGARVEVNERKDDPADFALWKGAKPGEPSWPSPWGPGRPGWHIECSAMSLKYLGMGFDMHGGGTDLVFPHHENEIAQSEAYAGAAPFVRHWVHHEMLNVGGEKMSKSLKNYFNVKAAMRRFGAPGVRLFLISSHYRSPATFGEAELESANAAYERLRACFANARFARSTVEARLSRKGRTPSGAWGRDAASPLACAAEAAVGRFVSGMDDDFNTPVALSALFDLVSATNAHLAQTPAPAAADEEEAGPARAWVADLGRATSMLGNLAEVLGLVERPKLGGGFEVVDAAGSARAAGTAAGTGEPSPRTGLEPEPGGRGATGASVAGAPREGYEGKGHEQARGIPGVSVERLVESILGLREEARKARDFAASDRLRRELEEAGVVVEDTPLGPRWRSKR